MVAHYISTYIIHGIKALHCRLQYHHWVKIMCIWETSNKVNMISNISYIGGFESNLEFIILFLKINTNFLNYILIES